MRRKEFGQRNMCPLGHTRPYMNLERRRTTVAKRSLATGQIIEMKHTHLVLRWLCSKAYKLTLMIRDGLGNYSSVTDYDEWRIRLK